MILEGQRCPACHRLELVVENDRESCDRCGYVLELADMLAEPTHAPSRRDQDEDFDPPSMTDWQRSIELDRMLDR